MTTLKVCNNLDQFDFIWEDCNRIVKILFLRGFECSLSQAYDLWTERSNEWDAGWLGLPYDDNEVFDDIFKYCNINIEGSRQ